MVFFSLEMESRLLQTKICYKLCYSVWKETSHKPKSSSCKKVFPKCVYHWYNLLRWMVFIPFDNWRHYLLYKFIVTQRFGETAMMLCSLKQVLWKKPVLYIRYLDNNTAMLLIVSKCPQQGFYFLNLLIAFLNFQFVTFSFINGTFSTQKFFKAQKLYRVWNDVRDFITFFSFVRLCMKFNTLFAFIILSFLKTILTSYNVFL